MEKDDRAAGSEREDEEEELLPLACRNRKSLQTIGMLGRLLSKRTEKSLFGLNASSAFKGAVCIVVCNIPAFVVPLGDDVPKHRKQLTGMISLYIAFTLWTTLGETISFAIQGLAGTLLASLNVLIVLATVGATPESLAGQVFVWIFFVVPTWLMLFLNFDNNTRQLGLSTHAMLMMIVMSPDGLDLKDVQEHAYVVAMGCLWAVLTALVPPPPIMPRHTPGRGIRSALRHAEEELEDATLSIGDLFTDIVQAFCSRGEALEVEGWIARSIRLQDALNGLGPIIDAAWFEGGCFHRGTLRRRFCLGGRRAHLSALRESLGVLQEVADCLSMLAHVVRSRRTRRRDEPRDVTVALEDLVDFLREQLEAVPKLLFRARRGDDIAGELRAAARRKGELLEALSAAFSDAGSMTKKQGDAIAGITRNNFSQGSLADTDDIPVTEEVAEAAFLYHISRIADRLVTHMHAKPLPLRSGLRDRLHGLVAPSKLFDQKHLLFVYRQSITICVCFFLCTRFYDFTPTMVTTICLLVSEGYKGAMLKKNIGRLQGVVLGTVFPHLFYDWFSTCSTASAVALALTLFFYEWMALFVYFSSPDVGYIGVLVAGFGANAMCRGCGRHGIRSSSLYDTIEQNAMGIAILTVVDLAFVPRRASDVANRLMYNSVGTKDMEGAGVFPLLCHGFAAAVRTATLQRTQQAPVLPRGADARVLVPVDQFDIAQWNIHMITQLRLATQLSDEAASEPRFMRRAWPTKLYQAIVWHGRSLRLCVAALAGALDDDAAIELQDVTEYVEFVQRVRKDLEAIGDMVYLALKHFDGEKGGCKDRSKEIHAIARQLYVPQPDEVAELVTALMPDDARGEPARSPKDLAEYRFCRSSVVVFSLLSIVRVIHSLRAAIVSALGRG